MDNTKSKTVWNDKLEHVVLDIGESSKAYKIMHITVAQKATKSYSMYMLIGIILGPLSGVISGIGVAVDSENIIFPIIATILSFLSGIIIAIIKFNKFDEVISANKSAAAKYTSLESNVRRQLAVYRNNRIEAGSYVEWLNTTYENLFSAAPLLPNTVQDNYIKKAKHEGIKLPLIYSGTIDINTEYYKSEVDNVSDIHVERRESVAGGDNNNDSHIKSLTVSKLPRKSNAALSVIPELNEYSDGLMSYQMKRMYGTN
jgi:hypothetical protein